VRPRYAIAATVFVTAAIALVRCSGEGGVSTDYIDSVPTATLPAEFPPATIVSGGSAQTSPGQQRTYEIQPDDTVAGIAETFGVTIEAILEANPGLDPSRLVIGERIVIPGQSGTPSPTRPAPTATPRPEPTAEPAGPSPTPVTRVEDGRLTYVVQEGDYPELIAQKFGISTEELLAANPGIDPRGLHIGDVLVIPTPTPTPGAQ
jgi:LysM repeat protein